MRVIPAMDIIDGSPVRLAAGDYECKTSYSVSALDVARRFEDAGLEYLHLVDLDAAIGKGSNLKILERIATSTSLTVDFGGGIRKEEDARKLSQIPDITRDPLELPCDRPQDRPLRLQMLARADEGFLLGMAYSTQRGFGAVHPFTSELRRGYVECTIIPEELDFPLVIGEIEVTECVTISRYTGTALEPCFTQGYGLVFGNNERKSLSMSIVDRALRAKEMEEEETGPAQNPEFVLLHGDNVDASGFVQHIKLPHYVDFQAELSLIRELRNNRGQRAEEEASEGMGETSGEQA